MSTTSSAYLAASGVDYIFGVDGANIEDLYDAAFFRDDITAVLAKHEFSAATMADGYSRSSAGLGVVAATSGGGSLNTVPGLGEAFASRVPVLALIGQPPTTLDGRGPSRTPAAATARWTQRRCSPRCRCTAGGWCGPQTSCRRLPEAVAAARTGGPAVLLLPKNIQQSRDRRQRRCVDRAGRDRGRVIREAIARALRRADGPITIIAGEQVARDDARVELEQLRATLRARIATVPDAKDVADTPGLGSSSSLGVTGVMGHPGVADAVRTARCAWWSGTRLSVTARAGLDDALAAVRMLSIGSASPYLPCTHIHTDDLRGSLSLLTAALTGHGRPPGLRVPDECPAPSCEPPAFVVPVSATATP